MATGNKLEKALADAKGLSADLKTFSLDTNDQNAKQMFNMLSTNAESIAETLQNRLNFVKSEEPQYNENQ
ncbi:DUF1657 domain-containing protein [Clostridium sporogenes]|uniref:DUF1657 domain-containing protein n=1 Tax=Clostridium sporogenes TaxID=1509 RepID=A0A7U4JND2_CLOSG|nr:DUF1657 domain-containing protein [Clostridium sporogenes]AVP59324.1 DUF1657 domain-containing protein [Clostridium botulinum]AKC62288.1 hypothetical protein DUF1657 [Clostridium sporogenes]AKJ89566.1 hypothetical protein CLSPOx_07895 [Clostridium sporogenes]EHN16340.1 hypothetical protein IYC_04923 [Clostridium sporogenes PA 3679]KCZ69597.1 hypothetical protein DUF1657 [Clostridium sporogenes]